jgi:4-carboxymuconolactone decarboxylase
VRLEPLRPPGLTPEQQAVYDAIVASRGPGIVAEDGSLRGPFNAMLHHPVLGGPLQEIGAALRYRGLLPDTARELAILIVAAAYEAEFEWHAHSRIAGELGVAPAVLEAIRKGERPELADEVEQAVVDATRSFLAREDLDDAAYAEAARVIGEAELVELTTLVGYYGILATQMHLFHVPLPPGVVPAFSTSERLTRSP